MGRWSNYPDELESLRCITIHNLKKFGYLKSNVQLTKSIYWNNHYGERVSSIGIRIETTDSTGSITFQYTYNDSEKINYKVRLITRPSNLGDGLLWFFVCPNTGKVCRKLHFKEGYFLHRTAFAGVLYEKQLRSKKWREWEKAFGSYFNEGLYQQLYKKHFKRFYKGKPTKRYIQLMKKINAGKDINFEELERLLLR